MNREAIAHAARRRQALEALEFERSRATALRERLEAIILELHGAAVDEAAFARMTPEDVALVRSALQAEELDEPESFELDLDVEEDDPNTWREEEIARLEEELVSSDRRQHAFEHYLAALDGR